MRSGLVLDLRGNGGGTDDFVLPMLALFLTQPTPPVRMAWRASSARIADWESDLSQSTDPVVLQTLRTEIESARSAMAKGDRITAYLPTSVGEVTPDLDSHCSHTVVLLDDATCFSGCEVFTAMMQDLHLAKVAGERTGGAGGCRQHRRRIAL